MIKLSKSFVMYGIISFSIIVSAIVVNLFNISSEQKYDDYLRDLSQGRPEGWSEYKNNVLNYSFSYPSKFDLEKQNTPSIIQNDPNAKILESLILETKELTSREVFFVNVFKNPGFTDLNDLITWSVISSSFLDDLSAEFVNVNGMPMAIFSDSSRQRYGVYIVAGNKIYSILRYHFEPNKDTTRSLFEQIYGTLKIDN